METDYGKAFRDAFVEGSGTTFGDILSADVELDGSVASQPVHGLHAVWTVMQVGTSIHDSITWTTEARADDRLYLDWTARALGMRVDGVTVLRLNAEGRFSHLSVYYRPLAAVFAISAEMARRLRPGSVADHFYQG